MKVYIDEKKCDGCGLCDSICPSIFKISKKGKAMTLLEMVPKDMETNASEAKNQCPTYAITFK